MKIVWLNLEENKIVCGSHFGRVKQLENVYPMVVPGTGLHEMIGVSGK